MTARRRLAWVNAAVAAVLSMLAYVVVGAASGAGLAAWSRSASSALAIVPAAALAAGLASWAVIAWWENVDRDTRQWTPFGFALRTVVLAFLLFAPLVAACVGLTVAVDQVFAAAPGSLREALAWVPAIAVYAVLFGLLLGALPALGIEYFLCRRFLRQACGMGLEGVR